MRTTEARGAGLGWAIALAYCAGFVPVGLAALTLTPKDCREGAEFIGNAARARENGISAERFVARLDEDLVLIQAYPPPLRWFARDAEDARFLREWVLSVFERPASPAAHGDAFLAECRAAASAANE